MSCAWINPTGFTMRPTGTRRRVFPPWRVRTEYEFTLDEYAPLTFEATLHCFVQPDRHGLTDMGSIPEALQPFVPKDAYLASFILHDSGCRERGLYFASGYNGPYMFCPMPSKRVHALLRECIIAEGGWCRAWPIWALVRMFGPRFEISAP